MVWLKRSLYAAALCLTFSQTAMAQTTGATTTGGTTGQNQTLGGGVGPQSTFTPVTSETPTITATSQGAISAGNLSSSNILGGYYANPNYQGRQAGTGGLTSVISPGGFGTPLYGTSTGGATAGGGRATAARGGTTAGRTGATGAVGGIAGGQAGGIGGGVGGIGGQAGRIGGTIGGIGGGLGGVGGIGGRQQGLGGVGGIGGNNTNQQLSTGRSIAYTQTLRFRAPPVAAPQLQADIRTMLASSTQITTPTGISAATGENGLVVLSGTVADEDEARLVEGMVRLTPGVKRVQNDLKFDRP